MLKYGLLFLLFSWHQLIWATEFTSRIHDIDLGDAGEVTLVLLENGSVIKVPASQEQWLSHLEVAKKDHSWIRVQTDDERQLQSVITLEAAAKAEDQSLKFKKLEILSYRPTVMDSLDDATRFFRKINPGAKSDAECYNRAHVWAYEGFTKHEVQSMKVWIFFTRKYIRQYNFDWWFHVSPYTFVREDGTIIERTLDYKYARGPLKIKDWTDIFMKNRAHCPVIKKYTDFEYRPEEGSCFLMKTNMYYYQPLDIENLEKRNQLKTFWLEWELNTAYRQGFGI